MLKRSYAKLEDIPQALRSEYVLKDGKYVLDVEGFENVDSVLDKNQELLAQHSTDKTEITSLKGQVTKLTNEKTALEGKSLPDGHVAIPAADKPLYDTVKSLNLPAEEIKTKVTEHGALKDKERRTELAHVMKWKPEAVEHMQGLPEYEIRDKTENGKVVMGEDGKPEKVAIARIKDAKGVVTEKPLKEYFDQTPALKVFEPSLLAEPQQSGIEMPPFGTSGTGLKEDNLAGSVIASRYGHNLPKAEAAK